MTEHENVEDPLLREIRADHEASKQALEIFAQFPPDWRSLSVLDEDNMAAVEIMENLQGVARRETEAILEQAPDKLKEGPDNVSKEHTIEFAEDVRYAQGLIAFGIAYERYILKGGSR